MKWMRKKIIDWLFGTNFIDYEKLYNTYVETVNEYINYLDKEAKFIESMTRTIKINEQILHQNKVFIATLKENGIDINKINFNKEV